MELQERNCCVLTGDSELESLGGIANFPVFMGCVSHPQEKDLRADMYWSISKKSGSIQLDHMLPLDILYPESHGSGGVGRLWEMHHRAFAEFIRDVNPSSIFEIGGAHGLLAKEYMAIRDIPWVILEPNPSPAEGCRAKFIKGFFDDKFTIVDPIGAVVHSHVFEHIYDPDQFMSHLVGFMREGMPLLFSLPNMKEMLIRKYTNCINFEHTLFLTEDYVEYLLCKHGFGLVKKQYFQEDHSIFYSTIRDSSVRPVVLSQNLYSENKRIYTDYINYHEKLIKDLNHLIRATQRPVYLFGAHIFSQYLLVAGLDEKTITCLLDNDPKKQGKRLYGTNLKVASPKILKEIKDPIVILKAGFYNDEIREDILKNINSNAQFLE